jgi:putative molybdopterin biosynthesis protein
VLAGRADAGPGIRAVAGLLDLDFIPLRDERFDFIILKDRFFDQGIQLFLGLLRSSVLKETVMNLEGYDLSRTGEMVFPREE